MEEIHDPIARRIYVALFDSVSELQNWHTHHLLSRVVARVIRAKSKPGQICVLIHEYATEADLIRAETGDQLRERCRRKTYIRRMAERSRAELRRTARDDVSEVQTYLGELEKSRDRAAAAKQKITESVI